MCSQWDTKEGLKILAKVPSKIEIDHSQLTLMFYSLVQAESGTTFQVFPQGDVYQRAATIHSRRVKGGVEDDFCVTVLLTPEEEGTAYKDVLTKTMQRILSTEKIATKQRRQYRRILADTFRKIQRRGGSRDRSLCPYMYEKPIGDGEIASFCRVVKKRCYLTIYQMPGYLQCPRYLRRERQKQLANARQIVRAGIQQILDEYDKKRPQTMSNSSKTWTEPIRAIITRLFTVLPVSEETVQNANQLVTLIEQRNLFQGHPRPILAAAIAYLAAKQTDNIIPENDIIELVGCSRTSLRRNYRELLNLTKNLQELPGIGKQSTRRRHSIKTVNRAE